jgi:phosphatidylserine/phosphatidylglycerophosphate/cardiolipin synthase-like enzyme
MGLAPHFLSDLEQSQSEVIIESPFITIARMKTFWPVFRRLVARGVKVYVVTRDPREHTDGYAVSLRMKYRNLRLSLSKYYYAQVITIEN